MRVQVAERGLLARRGSMDRMRASGERPDRDDDLPTPVQRGGLPLLRAGARAAFRRRTSTRFDPGDERRRAVRDGDLLWFRAIREGRAASAATTPWTGRADRSVEHRPLLDFPAAESAGPRTRSPNRTPPAHGPCRWPTPPTWRTRARDLSTTRPWNSSDTTRTRPPPRAGAIGRAREHGRGEGGRPAAHEDRPRRPAAVNAMSAAQLTHSFGNRRLVGPQPTTDDPPPGCAELTR